MESEVTVWGGGRRQPVSVLLRSYVSELGGRRHLLYFFIASGLKERFSRFALGCLWWLIDPLLALGTYVFLIQVVLRQGESRYPLFLMTILLPWQWFNQSVGSSASLMMANSALITQVRFPVVTLVIARLVTDFVVFLAGLFLLVPMMLAYHVAPTANLLWLPVLMAVQGLVTLAVMFPCAVWGAFFNDFAGFLPYVLRVWFYVTPGLYAFGRVPESIRPFLRCNPFTTLFEGYRGVILDGVPPRLADLGILAALSAFAAAWGGLYFIRNEKSFARYVTV